MAQQNPRLGTYVKTATAGETLRAFIPPPLPPNPPLEMGPLYQLLERANQSLGRLDGLATLIPDINLFLYVYVRKEAVLSSQIEGTQSSLSDLLLFENAVAPGVPLHDVEEVSSYVAAMQHGLRRIAEGFPLSLRLIREMHKVLLGGGRGANKMPGQFRRSQNWVGGTRPGNAVYVPPPPDRLLDCLDSFERFLHNETSKLPLLIELGLIHAQFETIHPFLDGNGRLGRLLISLLLCAKGALREPLLYPSLYFKIHRGQYYDLLQKVRTHGAWEEWLVFFLEGIETTARQAADVVTQSLLLFEKDRKTIESLGRSAPSASRVHGYMQKKPIITIGSTATALQMSVPVVTTAVTGLVKLGIVKEVTGNRRNRLFSYSEYMKLMSEGTEPL